MTSFERTMRERPLLFSSPMVRAILDDRKTQTRRIVKPQPPTRYDRLYYDPQWWWSMSTSGEGSEQQDLLTVPKCPYGAIGDRLWVRETFWLRQWGNTFDGVGVDYKAGGDSIHLTKRPKKVGRMCCWMPSIHMPRWASRITLEITGVRVERLNDIGEEDAAAEGVVFGTGKPGECRTCAKGAYMDLWNSINGADAWLLNPWVWVIEFKKVTQ